MIVFGVKEVVYEIQDAVGLNHPFPSPPLRR